MVKKLSLMFARKYLMVNVMPLQFLTIGQWSFKNRIFVSLRTDLVSRPKYRIIPSRRYSVKHSVLWSSYFHAGREVGFWDWGGQKNFPGRGKPKSLFSGEFRPQSNSLGQGWDRMGSFTTCPRLLGGAGQAGQKYWGGHSPPGPPSTALPDMRS